MYTIVRHTDVVNKEKRRRIVTVTFSDGPNTFDQEFQFSIETEIDTIKRVVKQFLEELNFVPPTLDGDITSVPAPVEPIPTQAELDFQQWVKDRADLKKLKELVAEGIIASGTTQQTNLQNKVTNGWKNTYFNQI